VIKVNEKCIAGGDAAKLKRVSKHQHIMTNNSSCENAVSNINGIQPCMVKINEISKQPWHISLEKLPSLEIINRAV
jgi:hypothetical protein